MSDERLAEIRARLEAATPGPWVASEGDGATWVDSVGRNGLLVCNTGVISNRYSTANTRLIANAPADLAYLLAELAAAQAREQACTERIKDALDCLPRALDGSRPFSLDQRAEVMLAIEALRAALAAAGRGRGDGGR